MERMRFVVEFLRCQRNGDEHEQPEQWVATDFLKEQLHGAMIQFPQTLAIRNTTKVQWADRMDSIKTNGTGHWAKRLIWGLTAPTQHMSLEQMFDQTFRFGI